MVTKNPDVGLFCCVQLLVEGRNLACSFVWMKDAILCGLSKCLLQGWHRLSGIRLFPFFQHGSNGLAQCLYVRFHPGIPVGARNVLAQIFNGGVLIRHRNEVFAVYVCLKHSSTGLFDSRDFNPYNFAALR